MNDKVKSCGVLKEGVVPYIREHGGPDREQDSPIRWPTY